MHFQRLDRALRVDHERAAQSQAFFGDVHAESVGQCVRGVAHQRELCLAHGRRGFVPHLVREVRVGRNDVDLSAGLLEFCIVVSSIFHFGRAVERERGRHEDQHGPLALERLFRNGDELAVVESFGLERLNLRINQRHSGFRLSCLVDDGSDRIVDHCIAQVD